MTDDLSRLLDGDLPPDEAARTLRLGLGRFTSAADVDFAAAALARAHQAVARHPIPVEA